MEKKRVMKKIGIIGAGISGLSLAKQLGSSFEVELLEKNSLVGGIARTRDVDGIAYHTVGGHCLNSKNQKVMEFIFNEILSKDNWHKVQRVSKIFLDNHFISYPIEFATKEIAEFDKELAFNITKDFLSSREKGAENLEQWLRQTFGDTLAEKYFIPYNTKIWQSKPCDMSYQWIKDKLPIPNKKEFFEALIKNKKDTMPHSTFFYPNSNNQNSFIEALAEELNIVIDFEVTSITKDGDTWVVNNSKRYDVLVSTMPLDELPFLLSGTPNDIRHETKKLKYNKITNMLWKNKPTKNTWTYYPDKNTIFHRHIHIGNFFSPSQSYTITEAMGEHSYDEMVEYGKKFDYLEESLDYNVSKHAYVVYDKNYKETTMKIREYMKKQNLYLLGRFGEWEYYNMDICIEKAMGLADSILEREK